MSDDDSGGGSLGTIIKWIIILLLSAATGGTFLLIYLGWKYVKICILFYFKALYLIIRLPIWLFIQLPLHYIGVGMKKSTQACEDAYGLIKAKKKKYGFLFGSIFLFLIYSFLPRNTDAIISTLTNGAAIMPFLVLIPFTITFFVALLSTHLSSPDIARKHRPSGLNTGVKESAAGAAGAAATAGQAGMKAYNSVEGDNLNEKAKNVKETANTLESKGRSAATKTRDIASEAVEGEGLAAAEGETILATDMVATLEGMPYIGSMLTGAGAGAGSVASAGSTIAGAGASVGLGPLAAALVAAIAGFAIISVILTGLIIYVGGIVVPMILGPILGPIMGALGLGQSYGNWISTELTNSFLPQVNLEAETRMIEQAGAKISCALQGPACLRRWRLNNTARPGSEDVGEKYTLKVADGSFTAGTSGGLDIAYKRSDYEVPVRFLLKNTRHGLKGITARDVHYRLRIVDGSRSGKRAYCSTGWKDVASTAFSKGKGNILPGTTFSPTLSQLQGLTIENCDMLQPALGHTYTAKLNVRYDYSSQSTLYFEAMSRQHMLDEGISPEFKPSKTADTPVETSINVKAPVTYVETESGGTRPIPFTVKVDTTTDRLDVEYYVHPDEFVVTDSSKTDIKGENSCIGLKVEDGAAGRTPGNDENVFKLSEVIQTRMDLRVENGKNGEPLDVTTWFDRAKNPSTARCTFQLTDAERISPTGETLTMGVDANYTVNIEKTSDPFEVKNTRCSQFDCPILFYVKGKDISKVANWENPPKKWEDNNLTTDYRDYKQALCEGIDAGNGCSAAEEYYWNYQDVNITGGIDEGEIAVGWNKDTVDNNYFGPCLSKNPGQIDRDAVGINPSKLKKVQNSNWKRLRYDEERNEFTVNNFELTITERSIWSALGLHDKKTVTFDKCKGGLPAYDMSKGENVTKSLPYTIENTQIGKVRVY